MPNHAFVWYGGVAGERKKRSPAAALVGASALTVAVFLYAAMPTVSVAAGPAVGAAAKPALRLESVSILDEGTVDSNFSNPMDPTKLREEQFQAPHYYWVVPHTHIAVAFGLRNGNRTVRSVLDRGVHPIEGRCLGSSNTDDPRCSTDTLDWEVVGATDIYGQKITNKDWKVWTTGAKKHPGPCRPGCR